MKRAQTPEGKFLYSCAIIALGQKKTIYSTISSEDAHQKAINLITYLETVGIKEEGDEVIPNNNKVRIAPNENFGRNN